MAIRIFHPSPLKGIKFCTLSAFATRHLQVLRVKTGEQIILFDGSNHIFPAKIVVEKKQITAEIFESIEQNNESPLQIHLGQVISKGERMEWLIQKAVELGVTSITPLIATRSTLKLDQDRLNKKSEQWQQIAISACEQCTRNIIPKIHNATKLVTWANEEFDGLKISLDPRATENIKQIKLTNSIKLQIGGEGGLTDIEILELEKAGFKKILLGNRVLRTETATLASITALQVLGGDL